ncbi:MAG TPA: hypothetical protein VIV60_21030 [Polyangiaceae bacterium]
MANPNDILSEQLARLSVETADVRPTANFTVRVMAAVELQSAVREDWSVQVLKWSKLGVAVASLAAAAGVALAWHSYDSVDQEEALAYGVMEAFE